MRHTFLFLLLFVLVAPATAAEENTSGVGPDVPPFWVRPGYRVTLASDELDDARFLAFDDKGTLYVSEPKFGIILALRGPDANGRFQKVTKFVANKALCHAIQFRDGWLWFSVSSGVYRARDTKGSGVAG